MALFEDEEFTEEKAAENPYLNDPGKGMNLIKSMISLRVNRFDDKIFESIVKTQLFPVIAELGLSREADIYSHMNKLSDKLKDVEKLKLLHQKKVIGIGGKFSAGKSCFINSLTNSVLPEGQRPTTSIATYIVYSDVKKNIAITNNDNLIELDDEAIAAITHQFFENYNIGFSRIIKNLVVSTDEFPYTNVAILDTPGYSKADTGKNNDGTDADLAREQLRSVDYLIWLVDSTQGVMSDSDFNFISSLNLSTEILVVFTKADTDTKENLQKKIDHAKKTLSDRNKKYFGVIAYNSRDRETVIGENELNDFMRLANDSSSSENEIHYQLYLVNEILLNDIEESIEENNELLDRYSSILANTYNTEHISSIVNEYSRSYASIQNLKEGRDKISESFVELIKISNDLTG